MGAGLDGWPAQFLRRSRAAELLFKPFLNHGMKLERLHHRSEPSLHCLKEKVAILTIASVQPAQYVLFVIYYSWNNNKPIRASAITRRAEFLKTFGVAVLVLGYITASIV